jgi:hypothetical protein
MTDALIGDPPVSDPLAVVVARMEGKLDAALARMDSQSSDITDVSPQQSRDTPRRSRSSRPRRCPPG